MKFVKGQQKNSYALLSKVENGDGSSSGSSTLIVEERNFLKVAKEVKL